MTAVFGRAVRLLSTHWRTLLMIAFVSSFLGAFQNATRTMLLASGVSLGSQLLVSCLSLPLIFAGAVLSIVGVGAMTFAASQGFRGREVTWRDAMRVGYRRGLPVLGAGLAYTVMVGLGFLLCVLPGIWVAVSFVLALPILIDEESKIGDAFSRSRELTKRCFWSILLMFTVLFLGGMLLGAPTILLMAVYGFEVMSKPEHAWLVLASQVFGFFAALVTYPFGTAVSVATLFHIRAVTEGERVDHLTQVFE